MLEAIFDFIYDLFHDALGGYGYDYEFTIFGNNTTLTDYLTLVCGLISFIFIIVLCCLFVYKIIKLVGGLITR